MAYNVDMIEDYLITALRVAESRNDTEIAYRVSRAILALNAPLTMDIFVDDIYDFMSDEMKVVPMSWLKH